MLPILLFLLVTSVFVLAIKLIQSPLRLSTMEWFPDEEVLWEQRKGSF